MKTALITGVGGQDGGYLAAHLLAAGYRVVGTSRDPAGRRFDGLRALGIHDRIVIRPLSPLDTRGTRRLLAEERPDEVYALAGQTSVAESFRRPVETFESNVVGVVNLLEAIRGLGAPIALYNAGSSEMFGDTGPLPATESTPVRPRSPYGVAKATTFWQVAQYREAYGIRACTGILFNHESPLRPERFVTQKIAAAAARIAAGARETLQLGDITVRRDWGWAPEYVVAMHAMLQRGRPEDLVIATGHTRPLAEFVEEAFAAAGLDWRRHVRHDPGMVRPSELACGRADPSRARAAIGWRARLRMPDVARLMVEARLAGRAATPALAAA